MEVKVVRSNKRRKTISGREVDGVFVVQAPASMSDAELQPIIQNLQERWQRRRTRQTLDDSVLERRASQLNKLYFGQKLKYQSIRWATDQNKRFGSCTPTRGTIRISHRLATMPVFVRDYVIMHELAHLVEPNHGPGFWKLVNRFPRTERARGYLMAVGLEDLEE